MVRSIYLSVCLSVCLSIYIHTYIYIYIDIKVSASPKLGGIFTECRLMIKHNKAWLGGRDEVAHEALLRDRLVLGVSGREVPGKDDPV